MHKNSPKKKKKKKISIHQNNIIHHDLTIDRVDNTLFNVRITCFTTHCTVHNHTGGGRSGTCHHVRTKAQLSTPSLSHANNLSNPNYSLRRLSKPIVLPILHIFHTISSITPLEVGKNSSIKTGQISTAAMG